MLLNCRLDFLTTPTSKLAAITAMGLGSRVIERHITLSKKMKGPDHLASDDPEAV